MFKLVGSTFLLEISSVLSGRNGDVVSSFVTGSSEGEVVEEMA